jgi:transposase
MTGRWEVTGEQWELLEPLLRPMRREDNRGRPWHDTRSVLNGVLWTLGSGAQRSEMPEKYPPYQTCHRRFQQWLRDGRLVLCPGNILHKGLSSNILWYGDWASLTRSAVECR